MRHGFVARHNGTTTIAATGPLDDDALDEASLRTCDIGHVAIAWRDWDAVRCPICQRFGTVSGGLVAMVEARVDNMRDDANAEKDSVEADLVRLTDKAREAMDLLLRAFENDKSDQAEALVAEAHRILDLAL